MIEKLSLGIFLAILVGLFSLLFRACTDEQREMQACRDRGGVPIIVFECEHRIEATA